MPVIYEGGSYKVGTLAVTNGPASATTERFGFTLYDHFNILTGTITNATVTIQGTLDDVRYHDVTNDLFGVATLVSNDEYMADTYMTYKDLQIVYTPSDPVNAINLEWMVKKGGGR